ncbi:MAG: cytochrome P450, partial [Myxococcales bacterium]|nr:cytochrome P450 [Myxococcales bacterium]
MDPVNLHDLEHMAAHGYPWEAWDLLRRESPVHWYDHEDVEPFWAITKHADVLEISKRSDIFINGGPRLRFTLKGQVEQLRFLDPYGEEQGWDPDEPSDFVFMDDPRHKKMRSIASRAFTPGRLKESEPHFLRLAEAFATEFEHGLAQGPQDFVRDYAVKLPLAAIGEMFSLPPDDWRQILAWTDAINGDFGDGFRREDERAGEAKVRALKEFRGYLRELVEHRRNETPTGRSLLDEVIAGRVDGVPLTEQQLNGYLVLLIAAGNETTRTATAGGLLALLEHPEQLSRLFEKPELLDSAIEEMLRWTSPVYHFFRTATEDYELRGVKICAGDTVGLFYPSANRDE